jgi:hypothetical protein
MSQNSIRMWWTLQTFWCKLLKILTKRKSAISHVKKNVKKWAKDNLLQENEKA